tara:strand:- start:149 stop:280 length:132 start_codon:yes stop_codon:yes gene_type:complete
MVFLTFWQLWPPFGFGVNVRPWRKMVKAKGDRVWRNPARAFVR